MNEIYILYGSKDDQKFYIMNTNPLIWATDVRSAKTYSKRYYAEYELLREYNNYHAVGEQLEKESLDHVYVALIDSNFKELGRLMLL